MIASESQGTVIRNRLQRRELDADFRVSLRVYSTQAIARPPGVHESALESLEAGTRYERRHVSVPESRHGKL